MIWRRKDQRQRRETGEKVFESDVELRKAIKVIMITWMDSVWRPSTRRLLLEAEQLGRPLTNAELRAKSRCTSWWLDQGMDLDDQGTLVSKFALDKIQQLSDELVKTLPPNQRTFDGIVEALGLPMIDQPT
jgi:hypothetical protein